LNAGPEKSAGRFSAEQREEPMRTALRGFLTNLLEQHRRGRCIRQAAREIVDRGRVVALTGAGISVESGIPDFRDPGGLWERFDPMEYAHIDAFRQNPEKTWRLLRELEAILDNVEPSAGHLGLHALEEMGFLTTVITQNVDGLHQRAGNTDVIEYHGNNRFLICVSCDRKYPKSDVGFTGERNLPRCVCGAVLKPDAVLFGEPIPRQPQFRAQVAARQCGIMLVVGTSATVYPASHIPVVAKSGGALIIEINVQKTVLTETVTDIFLQGQASEVFPRLVTAVHGVRR
jgi:NAD-dependent deacetylase